MVSYFLIICCGQGLVVSYCLIICCGQGLVVSYCLIICCGQGLVVCYCLIICCGQGLVVSYCLIICLSFAVVRGSWSAIGQLLSDHLLWSGVGGQLLSHHLLWSGVGGQLLSHHLLFGQLLSYHLLWSRVGGQLLSYHLLWSGVGGQLLSYHVGGQYCTSSLQGPFRGAFGKTTVFPVKQRYMSIAIPAIPRWHKGDCELRGNRRVTSFQQKKQSNKTCDLVACGLCYSFTLYLMLLFTICFLLFSLFRDIARVTAVMK